MRGNAWKSLERRLNVPVADVKRRWKAIRDHFARIKRLNNNIPSGASPSQASQNSWNLYSSLTYLISHVQTRKSFGNISKSFTQRTTFVSHADDDVSEREGEIEYLDDDVMEYLNTQDSLNDNADQPKTNQNWRASNRLSKENKNQLCQDENVPLAGKTTDRNIKQSDNPPQNQAKKTTEKLENQVISALKNVQETFAETNTSVKKDVEWNFCMSLYGSLEKMTKRQQKFCKFEISKILFDLESESD